MAAAIVTIARVHQPGDRKEVIVDFTPSTSYPALGEPLTASLFGMQQVDTVIPAGLSATTTLHVAYDATNNKLRLYTAATGAEVATASDQSANKVRLLIQGL